MEIEYAGHFEADSLCVAQQIDAEYKFNCRVVDSGGIPQSFENAFSEAARASSPLGIVLCPDVGTVVNLLRGCRPHS